MLVSRIVAVLILLVGVSSAYGAVVEGRDYLDLGYPVKAKVGSKGKVEIAEIFYYGCPHCYEYHQKTAEWRDRGVEGAYFVRIPAITPLWVRMARGYFAMEKLGITEKVHDRLFYLIHEKNKKLRSLDKIAFYISEYGGVPKEMVLDVMKSPYVDARVKRAKRLLEQWGINSVPAVVVGGQYMVIRPASNIKRTKAIVESLVERLTEE